MPSISVAQFVPTVQTLTDTLDQAGYQVILGQTGYDRAREEALLSTMLRRRPDAIVMAGLVGSAASRERLGKAGIPVVETWDLTDHPVDMVVGFSHLKVGSAIAGYFLSKGWSRFGLATGDDQRAAIRREGFLATVGRQVPTATVAAPSDIEAGRRALGELLAQDAAIEAVCCSSDQMAQGVLIEAQARGLRVPQDLAVCGFGNAGFAAHLIPSMTAVHVDGPAVGRLAAELVVARWCRDRPVEQRIVDVGFRIIERQSTGGN